MMIWLSILSFLFVYAVCAGVWILQRQQNHFEWHSKQVVEIDDTSLGTDRADN